MSRACLGTSFDRKNHKIVPEIQVKTSETMTYSLREGLSTSGGTQVGVETERLGDGEVSLHGVHGGTDTLLGREDVTTTDVQTRLWWRSAWDF